MPTETHSQIAGFIWSICNLLRGPYKRNEYRKVILPLTVLRRFDCILAPTKAAVLKEHATIKAKGENIIRHRLSQITGVPFYNLSKFTMAKPAQGSGLNGLLDDPNQLAPNLNSYINGFSPNVRAIMERFGFDVQIAKMAEKDLLYLVIKAFIDPKIDLSFPNLKPDQANVQMGYVFEELIRIGAEQSNEEAGEHFTPREVIRLMVNLLLSPEKDLARSHVVKTIYDPACGTGGMLSVSEKYIRDLNSDAQPKLFGQDWNDEAWAVCKSDMLIKGEDADNIIMGDTFTKDGFDRTPDSNRPAVRPFVLTVLPASAGGDARTRNAASFPVARRLDGGAGDRAANRGPGHLARGEGARGIQSDVAVARHRQLHRPHQCAGLDRLVFGFCTAECVLCTCRRPDRGGVHAGDFVALFPREDHHAGAGWNRDHGSRRADVQTDLTELRVRNRLISRRRVSARVSRVSRRRRPRTKQTVKCFMLPMIDNYDSVTCNRVQYLGMTRCWRPCSFGATI